MIAIIDYGMGNLHSVLKAFRRINSEVFISSDVEEITKADKLVLPGVGHFKHGMEKLDENNLINPLNEMVLKLKKPILGICLGVQLFTKHSEEGDAKGLGWINAKTIKFKDENFKIPHMGWNNLIIKKKSKLLEGLNSENNFYFVHSYHLECKDSEDILANTVYSKEFTSVIEKENIYGTQFHPEKSHAGGLEIIKNFAFKI